MNPLFLLIVCGGVFLLLLFVASLLFNAAVSGGGAPAPWMRRLRQYQNQMENAGWRIQMLPYDDASRPMIISQKGWRAVLPLVGAFGFVAGLALAVYGDGQHLKRGLIFAVASWLVALFGWWLKNREVRRRWEVAPARCVDRELGKTPVRGGWRWVWRIVCEYEYRGVPYRVTPEVHCLSNFTSQAAAYKFLDERISPQGECRLRVDPKNPLHTELVELEGKGR